ncbi:MAG TPA: hypothetical protein DIV86_02045, partial [Alphaproteobacteria bacterium]|nr:hypothetical protein [Alphaproteobacteria bacterium]
GNYKDGDGNTVRSSFVEKSGNLILGFTPQDAHIYFGVEQNKIEDSLFAGSSMDSPISDGKTYRAGIEKEFENGALSKIDLSAYASLVEHLMDNYSLRAATGMRMRADSESDTYGAKLKTDFNFSDELVKTVLEYKSNNRDATRKQGMTPTTVTNLQSILWPDITTEEMSVALETTKDINYNNRLTIGARYDYVVADFGKANQISSVTSLSANNLYNTYYGYTASEQKENNFGGLARIEHDLTNDVMLYSGLSRSVRTADATERGMASYSGMGGSQSWVGNPRIEPEKHHQLDAGFRYTQSSWNVDISAYANKVSDYILKDSARGQSGILVNSPNVTVYRNVDALLSGFELSGSWDISSSLSLNSNAVYTYGENESDNSVLAQIPALQGSIGAEWRVEDYLKFGSDVRWAAKQTRVDTNRLTGSGRDVAKTGGYAVLDLNATLTKLKPVELTFGINNLFDTKYADHLNRSSISDPTEIQVNEVGRSLFVQGKVRF